MDLLQWIYLLTSSWLPFHVGLAIYNVFLHLWRKYPGPKLDAASQLPYIYYMIEGDSCKYIASLHEKYGEIVRTGPNEISYITASANKPSSGPNPPKPWPLRKIQRSISGGLGRR
ncbi:benzoate 4-monooxygenase cytochrome P450 [Penicillium capsulatum]|uniref:Benzoate 4-monooxygenase cytochrome P450 n=1 Tax=Penicillium capsulatum TaxID=69766 RepID=A0A9W9LZQ6_9EURO|nr:benzoate 4-monooxygenase cytochrome P450 [Penicillium capsulatum]